MGGWLLGCLVAWLLGCLVVPDPSASSSMGVDVGDAVVLGVVSSGGS